MKERKYVKFRTDMYEDTKFKIIDRKPQRDLIHYVWNRVVVLAGKVNLEGDLYFSKNIPYTIETLSIELNREANEIKTALDVLMELQMIELVENKVYRVTNFAKHQNIKVKEKIDCDDKEINTKNNSDNKAESSGDSKDTIIDIKSDQAQDNKNIEEIIVKASEPNVDNINININAGINKTDEKIQEITENKNEQNIKEATIELNVNNVDENISDNTNSEENCIISLDKKSNKKSSKSKKKDNSIITVDEDVDDNPMFFFTEGELTLGEGETLLSHWDFGS